MSALDDARVELAEIMEGADRLHPCGYCGADVVEPVGAPIEHEDGCKVPAMTRIVAALEAAVLLLSRDPAQLKATDPEWKAFKAALKD